jgi:hypothetical protein
LPDDPLVAERNELERLLVALEAAAEKLRTPGVIEQGPVQQAASELAVNVSLLLARLDQVNALLLKARGTAAQ